MKKLLIIGLILVAAPSWAISEESRALVEQLRAKLNGTAMSGGPEQIPGASDPGALDLSGGGQGSIDSLPPPLYGGESYTPSPKKHKSKKHLKGGKAGKKAGKKAKKHLKKHKGKKAAKAKKAAKKAPAAAEKK